jgi:hypothetical protein
LPLPNYHAPPYERKATSLCDSLAGIGHGKGPFSSVMAQSPKRA